MLNPVKLWLNNAASLLMNKRGYGRKHFFSRFKTC